jgi:hypothetical protein
MKSFRVLDGSGVAKPSAPPDEFLKSYSIILKSRQLYGFVKEKLG